MTATTALAKPKPRHELSAFRPTQHRQVVSYNRLDQIVFERTADAAPILPDSVRLNANRLRCPVDSAAELAFDVFATFFRRNPKPSGMGPQLSRDIVDRVMADQRFNDIRTATVSDGVASALATVSLTDEISMKIPQELREKAEQERKAREEYEDRKAYAETLDNDVESMASEVAEARDDAEKSKEKYEAVVAEFKALIRDNGKKIQEIVVGAMTKADESAQAVVSSGNAFGFGSMEVGSDMDVAARLQLAKMAQKSGPAFAELLRIIGRLTQEYAQKSARKYRGDTGEVCEIGVGNDVPRLLVEELVALSDKSDPLALPRFMDRTMGQIEVETKETAVKGDVIFLLDESGSMSMRVHPNAPAGCTREAEAKGLVIAIAHAMLRQGRSVRVLFFQSTVTHRVDICPADIARRSNGMPVASQKLAEIAARGTNGGTLFDAPLTEAMDVLESGKMNGADVMMVTDGCSSVSDATSDRAKALRKKHGVTFYGLAVGNEARGMIPVFERFADRVFSGDSLMAGAAGQLLDLI